MSRCRFIRKALNVFVLLALLAALAPFGPVHTVQAVQGPILLSFKATNPDQPVEFKGKLYFNAGSDRYGREMWQTDGTWNGTTLLDINPGSNGSAVNYLTVAGDNLFFVADDGVHGTELWATDGTSAGTRLVRDINPGSGDADIERLTTLNSTLFFTATDPDHGTQIWQSDGTSAHTMPASNFGPDILDPGWPPHLVALSDNLIIFNELVDGSMQVLSMNPATKAITTLYQSPQGKTVYFDSQAVFNGRVYFILNIDFTKYLYRTDGTPSGTMQLAGTPDVLIENQGTGSTFYFEARANDMVGLWKLTTTNETPQLVKELSPVSQYMFGIRQIVSANGLLFFSNCDGTEYGACQLWKSDGSPAGTAQVVSDMGGFELVLGDSAADFSRMAVVGRQVFFVAAYGSDGSGVYNVWSSDGTPRGTHQEVYADYAGHYPKYITAFQGKLFFGLKDYSSWLPWIYDPGTNPVRAYQDNGGANENTPTTIDVLRNDNNLQGGQVRLADSQTTSMNGGVIARVDNGTPNDLTDDRLVYTPLHAFAGWDRFNYTVQDEVGNSDSTYVEVDVQPNPDDPIRDIYLNSGGEVQENQPANTQAATFTIYDPATNNVGTCQILNGASVPFTMRDNRLLTTRPLDYEQARSYDLLIRCVDANNAEAVRGFTIYVIYVDEPPNFTVFLPVLIH